MKKNFTFTFVKKYAKKMLYNKQLAAPTSTV